MTSEIMSSSPTYVGLVSQKEREKEWGRKFFEEIMVINLSILMRNINYKFKKVNKPQREKCK